MRHLVAALVLAGAALLATVPAGAQSGSTGQVWSIMKRSGMVGVRTVRGQFNPTVEVGAIVNPGDMIETGPSGRVLLGHGADTVVVAENSILQVPLEERQGTVVLHHRGEAVYDVERKPGQRFDVETPQLTAVVKGTHFLVRVDARGSFLSVDHGLVQVTDPRTGQMVLVDPGHSVLAPALAPFDLVVSGSEPLPVVSTRLDVTGTPGDPAGGARRLHTIFGEVDEFNLIFGLVILSLTLLSVCLVLFAYWMRSRDELAGRGRD